MVNPIFMGQGNVNTQAGIFTGKNRKNETVSGHRVAEKQWEATNQKTGQNYNVNVGQSGPYGHVTHIDAKTTNKDGQEVSNGLTVIRNGDRFMVLDGDRSGFQPPKNTLDTNA